MLVDAVTQADEMTLQTALAVERPRLVAFCAHISGSWEAAEDLAQETLLEAWRARDRLRDQAGLSLWLMAIARNVCLRWRRNEGRESLYRARGEAFADALEARGAEDGDSMEVAIERPEVNARLEKALATLPVVTRTALIGAYVEETPQVDLAARLGLSEGALRVRLHRGKQALREALTPTDNAQGGWQATRIWCPFCGRRRLESWLDRASGIYAFRCSGPCVSEMNMLGSASGSPLASQFSSPKSLLAHHCLNAGARYRDALTNGMCACLRCGRNLVIGRWFPGDEGPTPSLLYGMPSLLYGIHLRCPWCGSLDGGSPWHLGLDTTEVQGFWRSHPRIRALPTREIETHGRPALVIGYESVTGGERLEIVADRATYQTLKVFGEAAR